MNLDPIRKAKLIPARNSSAALFGRAPGNFWEPLEERRMLCGATVNPALTLEYISPDAKGAASSVQGYTPAEIKSAYGFTGVTETGAGQTIALVDAFNDPNITSDLGTFDAEFGLAAPPSFKIVSQTGSSKLPATDAGWAQETALDVEWAHAIAPQANILLVEASDDSTSNLIRAVNYARSATGVSVVSMSWGGGEMSNETNYDQYFTTPTGHTGVTFVAAAGDEGAAGGAEWPASSPNVVAVGGTTLNLSGGTYQSETVWSQTSDGTSDYESTPPYQSSLGVSGRTTADVAYDADPNTGFPTYDSLSYQGEVGWAETGGTSAGTPQWAGIFALADQGRASAGEATLNGATGTLPALYGIYSNATTYANDFNDITTGSNGGSDSSGDDGFGGGGFGGGGFGGGGFGGGGFGGGFGRHHGGGRGFRYVTTDASSTATSASVSFSSAAVGYDGPSGLGTPKAAGLISSLVSYGATASVKKALVAKAIKPAIAHIRPADDEATATPPAVQPTAYAVILAGNNEIGAKPTLNRPEPLVELQTAVGLARPSASAAATAGLVGSGASASGQDTDGSLSGFLGETQVEIVVAKVANALKPIVRSTAVIATGVLDDARQAAVEMAGSAYPMLLAPQQILAMNHIDANATFGDAITSFSDELASIPRKMPANHSTARAWIVTGVVLAADGVLLARYRLKRGGLFNERVKITM